MNINLLLYAGYLFLLLGLIGAVVGLIIKIIKLKHKEKSKSNRDERR